MVRIERVNEYTWTIPKNASAGMRVPGIIYADDILLQKMKEDRTIEQCINVAKLPGIYKYSIVLPDGHEGYGFPIGGVAAFDAEDGVISPGGVGYDINCGVRLIRTNLSYKDIKDKLKQLLDTIFIMVPSGVGSTGKIRLSDAQLDEVLMDGVFWAVEHGYGWKKDIPYCEANGRMEEANPLKVSGKAKSRGAPQLGTLGSGNHFLEIQIVDKIYDVETAKIFGISHEEQIMVMIHTGSRGLGHQVCSDYLMVMERAARKYNLKFPERELVYAPSESNEAKDYFAAMACASNYAWANRQIILHWVRESFEKVLRQSAESLGMNLIYDVAHNIAKLEKHKVNGEKVDVYVHRKGATRAFPAGHPELPQEYKDVGQPVIIPGSMGTASYLLLGQPKAMEISFGSTAHGAGRMMSRAEALRQFTADSIINKLERRGILIKAASKDGIIEEAPEAYKDIDRVARVSHEVGIATLVARMVPLAVAKG
ncbi:MAG: RtcB family protein [Candidatus Methanomethylicia archaeon]|nr:RtcB family protein [Candidatus Methanomethylicia archaeon]MCX8169270.1 RtcB family protein [Candidatus Methanomethylicia archaeon]MDW7988948.1 RtcB family protein [Nitrososphaerota archaeon]